MSPWHWPLCWIVFKCEFSLILFLFLFFFFFPCFARFRCSACPSDGQGPILRDGEGDEEEEEDEEQSRGWKRLTGRIGVRANRNPSDRPTADVLLSQHPFIELDTSYNFYKTELYAKIKETYKNV